ncbi:Multiple RNA-binding domain-containing protein 1 [Neolecta irregularis DAH-3]|uniref:Multiple RNA-binding domain-containing protein 1 n=1 Tax=Neolecta irregularis (strain DAH-3) TaxID=1198029 RepID=A0A1U7LWL3_NEOID|nr:Multiple RNA-binding domain-containing protein 1 [Neolecta irregularis DAH-3]|eukprot:OLL27066.1 Multiple RNA-binding domain-containing protein 1 [Neolecta irregularis DAH-3]
MRTASGKSRRFGFLGFQSVEDAESAVKYFNRTFIDMSRMEVDSAKPIGDESIPRAWSRYTPGSTAFQRQTETHESEPTVKKRKIKEIRRIKDFRDPKFLEFLEVMKPQSQKKTWANEDLNVLQKEIVQPTTPSQDDDCQTIPKEKKKKRTKMKAEEISEKEIRNADPSDQKQSFPVEEITNDTTVEDLNHVDANMSDAEWLRSRTTRTLDIDDKNPQIQQYQSDEEHEKHFEKEELESEVDEAENEIKGPEPPSFEDDILKHGRLFVRNLSYTTTEEDLQCEFEKFGIVEEVHMPIDSATLNPKGLAYVLFAKPADALKAFQILDKQTFQGRLLHILPSYPKKSNEVDEFSIRKLPLKKQKEVRRKLETGKEIWNWNNMYMNADAVLDSTATRFGIKKSELIDVTDSGAAVTQALAETSIVNETKDYFTSIGISLNSFSHAKKSETILCVKNFPYGTTVEELASLFGAFGELGRVVLPPAGIIALIEFMKKEDCRRALKKLGYETYKSSILYLERAPRAVFTDFPPTQMIFFNGLGKSKNPEMKDMEETVQENPISTLFIKNLNFHTSNETLTRLFSGCDGLVSARINVKPDPKNIRKTLSMGFGFVEFQTKEQAVKAMIEKQRIAVDGHALQLSMSKKEEGKKTVEGKGTKVVVKNLPFEANKKDLRALLSAQGQLRSLRLPKKFDNSTRGFAFAEFVTEREAKNAIDSLRDTHYLGRHLIFEWAEKEATGDELVQRGVGKTKGQVEREDRWLGVRRKRKIDIDENGVGNDG